MSFVVSVRDTKYWEETLRVRGKLNLSDECESNSRAISQIIPLARSALSRYNVSSEDVKYISDSVAYLLRTDLVKTNTCLYSQIVPPIDRAPVFFGEDSKVRLINDPKLITKDFELRHTGLYEKLHNSGAEWFRCYSATIHQANFTDNLTNDGNSFSPAFVLADVTAFLLDTTQLIDYNYSDLERKRFGKELARDLSEI